MVHTSVELYRFLPSFFRSAAKNHKPRDRLFTNKMADWAPPLASTMVAVANFAHGPFPPYPREHVVPVTPEAQWQQHITAWVP